MDLKKGDTVKVIRGKYKGKISKITQIYPRTNSFLIEGVNIVKKATKPRKRGDKGGLIDKTLPIERGKVMLVCNKCQQLTRIRKKIATKGEKVRICCKCNGEI